MSTNGSKESPVVDRGRLTHKQSKQATKLGLQLQKAWAEQDADTVEALLEAQDQVVRQVVVSVPAGWLPNGVTLEQDDWLDHISQERYELLVELSTPPAPGEKKA